MRLSKMIKQMIVIIGGNAEDLSGKSISDLIKYSQPLVQDFIDDPLKVNSIATSKIKDNAITTNKIKSKAVTEDKLSDELSAKVNDSGSFVVIYTEDNNVITASDEDGNPITFEDITAAIAAGKSVKAVYDIMQFVLIAIDSNIIQFSSVDFSYAGKIGFNLISHNDSNKIASEHYEVSISE
jgi:hypothetical protein